MFWSQTVMVGSLPAELRKVLAPASPGVATKLASRNGETRTFVIVEPKCLIFGLLENSRCALLRRCGKGS